MLIINKVVLDTNAWGEGVISVCMYKRFLDHTPKERSISTYLCLPTREGQGFPEWWYRIVFYFFVRLSTPLEYWASCFLSLVLCRESYSYDAGNWQLNTGNESSVQRCKHTVMGATIFLLRQWVSLTDLYLLVTEPWLQTAGWALQPRKHIS